MSQLQSDKPVLVVSVLLHRPVCLDCISGKTGLSVAEVEHSLAIIGTALQVLRTDEGCDNCGANGPVYSLRRSAN